MDQLGFLEEILQPEELPVSLAESSKAIAFMLRLTFWWYSNTRIIIVDGTLVHLSMWHWQVLPFSITPTALLKIVGLHSWN